MGRKSLANKERKQLYNNLTSYLLSEPDGNPTLPAVPNSEHDYVIKTVALGLGSKGSCTTSTTTLNPLRQIVSRIPISVPIQGAYSTVYFVDRLSCGHEVAAFPQAGLSKARHRCPQCGEAQFALKFKPESVPSPRKKRVA